MTTAPGTGATADEPRPPPSIAPVRGRLAALSFGFVLLALVALTVIPILTTRQLEALWSASDPGLAGPDREMRELRTLLGEEMAALQAFRATGDPDALVRYRRVRREEETLLGELEAAEEGARPEAAVLYRSVRELAGRWHALPDGVVDGGITPAEFVQRLPGTLPVRDSLVAATEAVEREIASAVAEFEAAGIRVVVTQRTLSLTLGVLALLAAAVVARAAARERKLAGELARAVERETRLRREADGRREELQAVSESKARLTRGFSHDVKNPLGAADGYLQLLEDGIPEPVTPRQGAHVAGARRCVAAALNLIEDLLEIERASTGNIRVEWAPTDVGEVVREAVDEYRVQAEAKGLALRLELPPAGPVVTTDRTRVRQVLGNLVSNAVKYTPAGGVSVRVERRADGNGPGSGGRVAVEVTDTGIGIPPEKRHLLFQEFARFEPGAAKGTGIGLAISHRIVQALGGELRLESGTGPGSTFVLWLPVEGGDMGPGAAPP